MAHIITACAIRTSPVFGGIFLSNVRITDMVLDPGISIDATEQTYSISNLQTYCGSI